MERSDGNLVGRTARRPNTGVVPPDSDEPDLLDKLADPRQPVHQRSVLAPDLPVDLEQPPRRSTITRRPQIRFAGLPVLGPLEGGRWRIFFLNHAATEITFGLGH